MRNAELIVIGASLGGLDALTTILGALPEGFLVPIAIAQHRRADGDSRLADIFSRKTTLPVREPEDKDPVEPGHVYVAPADYHLLLDGERFSLSIDAPVSYARPSIDVLFESAAEAFGPSLVAVLLTGASEDGASGIAAAARRGGQTLVQDPATALSPIAPRAALARTRPDFVGSVEQIARRLAELKPPRPARKGTKAP